MDKARVLIVDDEERLREMIKEYLSQEEFEVQVASNGLDALELIKKNNYTLVLLDIMMPKMNGWETCKKIRKISNTPIIMLTALGEEYDKLLGFELGIDDYIVKPFSPKELLARIKAVIRRSSIGLENSPSKNIFKAEGLIVEYDSRNVYVDGDLITLTPKEYDLLSFFSKNPNIVFSRDQLLTSIWGYDFLGDLRTIDTHIKMLRESIKPYRNFIKTVWGTGYKFETGAQK